MSRRDSVLEGRSLRYLVADDNFGSILHDICIMVQGGQPIVLVVVIRYPSGSEVQEGMK